MHANRPLSKWEARKRWKMLTGLSAAALALHAVLLSGLELAWPGGETFSSPQAAVPAMQVRTLAATVNAPAAELAAGFDVAGTLAPAGAPNHAMMAARPDAAQTDAAAQAVSRMTRRALPTAAHSLSVRPAEGAAGLVAPTGAIGASAEESAGARSDGVSAPALAPATSTASAADTLLALDTTPAARKPAESSDPQPAADEAVPVYRTRVPPAATLRFRMQRGGLRGTADLAWRPAGSHYELHFDGKVAGLTALTQVSSGGIEANGLAPVRFTDQRLRHAVIAANFQREAGKITFSGPADEFPLWPGVQDRLSWMIQLSAIVQADAKLAQPGAKVAMHVVGARADAGVWVFRCVARESVDAAGMPVQAAKFVREPRGPYDTAAEVWLDPQRHDLPVRAALRSGDGDALELILQEANTAP